MDLSNVKGQATYLEYLLLKLREDLDIVDTHNKDLLDTDSSKKSYKAVFDKYFKKAKGSDQGGIYTIANTFDDGTEGNLAYFDDLESGKRVIIDELDIFKKYFDQINDLCHFVWCKIQNYLQWSN